MTAIAARPSMIPWLLAARTTFVCVGFAALAACAPIRFVSDYDEVMDRGVSDLQRKTALFFATLEEEAGTPACTLEHHRDFYRESKVDLILLKQRAALTPKNSITSEQLEKLGTNIGLLERLHDSRSKKPKGANCLGTDDLAPLESAFEQSYAAIVKFELAKKRGEQP